MFNKLSTKKRLVLRVESEKPGSKDEISLGDRNCVCKQGRRGGGQGGGGGSRGKGGDLKESMAKVRNKTRWQVM